VPSRATHFQLSAPSTAIAGGWFPLTVTAEDAQNNPVTDYTGTVNFNSSDRMAGLPGPYTFALSDQGTHVFTVILYEAGTQWVSATDTSNNSISGTTFVSVSPGSPAYFSPSGFPSTTTAGNVNSLTLTVYDQFFNIDTTYNGTVHFTSSDVRAGLPADYTYTPADGGVHSFSITMKSAGNQTVTCSDAANGLSKTLDIDVSPALLSGLAFSGLTANAAAGSAAGFTLSAVDAFGNTITGYQGTVHFSSSDALAGTPADYTFNAADQGSHPFAVTFYKAGNQTITANDTANNSITGSAGTDVSPGAAVSLSFAGLPPTTGAGTPDVLTITAVDAYGNVASGYTGTVQFSSNDPQASLPAAYAFTANDAGKHSFGFTLKTAGSDNVSASDNADGLSQSASVSVTPAAAAALSFSGLPASAVAGSALSLTVTAFDAYGNVASGYTGTLHFASNDPQASLPADYAFTAADAGKHTFKLTLKTAGGDNVSVSDSADGLSQSASASVSPAAAAAATFSGLPASAVAGSVLSLTVTAFDPYGNVASGYTGTLHFASNDPQASLPADYAFTPADAGNHTFEFTLKTIGSDSITASDTADGLSQSASVSVSPAAASSFTLAGFPSNTTSGAAHSFTLTAYDAYGNVATGYLGTVHFGSSDRIAQLPGDYQFTAVDAGVHSFSATLNSPGTQSLTANDVNNNSVTGSEGNITVQPGSDPPVILVTGFPSPTVAGQKHCFTLTVEDGQGHVLTSYLGTVHFSSSDSKAWFSAQDYAFAASDQGVHTFYAALKTAGAQSITATDASNNAITGSESGIQVSPGAATHLLMTGFPSPDLAGVTHLFTVTAEDAYGNVATGYRGTIHLTCSDHRAKFSVNKYTFTAADGGVHSFGATLFAAGWQKIKAVDGKHCRIHGDEERIQVEAAAASQLLVLTPSDVQAGKAFWFGVAALDAYGNLARFTDTVSFSSDGPGSLPGKYTFTGQDHGFHWFKACFHQPGSFHITVTDSTTGNLKGSSRAIHVRGHGDTGHQRDQVGDIVAEVLFMDPGLVGNRDFAKDLCERKC
jgi:hypothetical protein